MAIPTLLASLALLHGVNAQVTAELGTPELTNVNITANGEYHFDKYSRMYFPDVEMGGMTDVTVDFEAKLPGCYGNSGFCAMFAYGSYSGCGLQLTIHKIAGIFEITNGGIINFTKLLPIQSTWNWGEWHSYRVVKRGKSPILYIDEYEFDFTGLDPQDRFPEVLQTCEHKFTLGQIIAGARGTCHFAQWRNLKIYYNQALGPVKAAHRVVSDGTPSRPHCGWTKGCVWSDMIKKQCANKLCEAAGFRFGKYEDSSGDMCKEAHTSDTSSWFWVVNGNEYTTRAQNPKVHVNNAQITANCFEVAQERVNANVDVEKVVPARDVHDKAEL